jgi:hypothetical protein
MKKIALIIIVLMIALISVGFFWLGVEIKNSPYVESKSDIFSATFKVVNKPSISCGVLLDTGYALTCAHGLDTNNNGKLDDDEKSANIQFYGDDTIYSGDVLFLGNQRTNDIAVLKINNPPSSNIRLADAYGTKIGEEVFVVGTTNGSSIHMTSGYTSTPTRPYTDRASSTIYFGNSGGGVFNAKNELIGIVSMVATGQQEGVLKLSVPLYNPKTNKVEITDLQTELSISWPLADWCEYVPSRTISNVLEKESLAEVVSVTKEEEHDGLYIMVALWLISMVPNVWLFKYVCRDDLR